MRAKTLGFAIAVLGIAACSDGGKLMSIGAGRSSPDEFAILPTKQLSMPEDLNQLPPPTPGGSNRTDPTPLADAVDVLGGSSARLADQGIGAADGALVAYAARGGVTPDIRTQLAKEDAAWRAANSRRLLERVAGTNVYFRAYQKMMLDPWPELERWRRAGALTPSAPPDHRDK